MHTLFQLKKRFPPVRFFTPFALVILLFCGTGWLTVTGALPAFFRPETPAHASQRALTFAERVTYQRAIEDVYWHHRLWPKENPNPKPSLDAVMSQAELQKKVTDYLRNSQALEDLWQQPITANQLQAEMDRMAQHTKQPDVLRELFAALGNDPYVIAECLARPLLIEPLLAHLPSDQLQQTKGTYEQVAAVSGDYSLPSISDEGGCTDDTWAATTTVNAPIGRGGHTAVWTGSEMIVWGGVDGTNVLNTGGRYNPTTDSWAATTLTNAPTARSDHTAIWTGREMIIWGGGNDTGGRYNPTTDSWTATSMTNAPAGRTLHTAVWTGNEMIIWGGSSCCPGIDLDTGGRYNPSMDSWTATSTTNAPTGRIIHTAVWTGSEMIVWGGVDLFLATYFNTGGKYNPNTDSWMATNTTNAPDRRFFHTAVWTGSEMIVWRGTTGLGNDGGKYFPIANSWTATSTINAPSARNDHTAVWTGSEMIVWGGYGGGPVGYLNTGGRYCAPALPAQLGNISTRAFVQTGDNVMIGGFIVQGTEPKRVIIRAIGPELTQYGVPKVLADPTLELHNRSGALIASNDNWRHTIIGGIIASDQVRDILDSGHYPRDPRESAIIADLPAGNYTAIVRGLNNTTGVALVEVYDLSPSPDSILHNISTRSFVQTGDNVMIGGFIVAGTESKRVIVRAIGPELAQYGVPNPLADPTLELHDGTGALIASNNTWLHTIIGGIITTTQVRDIQNSGHAPGDPRESAIIADLPAGKYTAIVRGVNNTAGVALVEMYDLGQ